MQHPGNLVSGRRPAYEVAVNDFYRARAQASLQELIGRLQRKSVSLLSYEDVAHKLHVTGRGEVGQRPVPLEAIVGSVGRYNDFTRTFLPRVDADAHRWARVKTADVSQLPPVTVYKINGAYFILDGNHRVSVARREGLSHIDAVVIEVSTRVPLSPDDDPDALIVKAEQATFLARTHLDERRPDSDLRVSVAGQYAHLENHIEAYRYRVEEAEGRTLSDREAALRWYDEAYMPVVEVIREQGILRYFPGRTETDLYLWIATHQAELRNEVGWQVSPDVAAGRVLHTEAARRSWPARLRHWLQRLWPGRDTAAPPRSWAQERVLARYSEALFADVLLPFWSGAGQTEAVKQALILAGREGARVHGLSLVAGDEADDEQATSAETAFQRACEQAGVRATLARESGVSESLICRRALVSDIVVMGFELATVRHLLGHCRRPILVVPGVHRPIRSVLLVYDGTARAQEGLFAATYMAEAWDTALVVGVARRRFWQRITTPVRKYLALHEVGATFVELRGETGAAINRQVKENDCDLIIMPALRAGRRWRRRRQLALQVLRDAGRPVLIFS
ncbi:MAG TPA: ParB/RepB/Spo0J family partition protein [Candidatus Sulfomarinibacteraceae bacterium]|nr:ParB/RepB/Spo0J family partition protein [Candidatus Sulfomarinibacteraceae bacterium]